MDWRREDFVFVDRDKFFFYCLLQRPAALTKEIEDEALISSQNGDIDIFV